MVRQFDTFYDFNLDYISDSYKSLLRVRGSEGLAQQIKKLEQEWLAVIDEANQFKAECRDMYKRKLLLLPLKVVYQYKKGDVMAHYDRKKFYMPYFNFAYRRKSLTRWDDVEELLKEMRATVDETIMHMWVFTGFRDFYLRARSVAFQIEHLTEYMNLREFMLEKTGLEKSMLPKEMLKVPDQKKLPGAI